MGHGQSSHSSAERVPTEYEALHLWPIPNIQMSFEKGYDRQKLRKAHVHCRHAITLRQTRHFLPTRRGEEIERGCVGGEERVSQQTHMHTLLHPHKRPAYYLYTARTSLEFDIVVPRRLENSLHELKIMLRVRCTFCACEVCVQRVWKLCQRQFR